MKRSRRIPGVVIQEDGSPKVLRPLAMSTQDAADYCAAKGFPYKPKTLEVWRSYGKGPVFRKIMGRVYYRQEDLDRWMEGIKVQVIDPAQQRIRRPRKSEALAPA